MIAFKKFGVKIIGFTESNIHFTKYRIKTVDLDGILFSIYSPEGIGIPKSVERFFDADHWDTKHTKIKPLDRNTKKPNPSILQKIISDIGGKKANTIYIGDKLDRDVYMANEADVISVYAKYGHIITGEKYELLRDVTHWTDEEVEREKEFKKKINSIDIQPKYTIKRYDEILDIFKFMRFD